MTTASTTARPSAGAGRLHTMPRVTIGDRRFKRYHLTTDGAEIPRTVQEAAYAFVPALLPPPDDATEPAGFIVLRHGPDGARLQVFSWVEQIAVHAREAAAPVVPGEAPQFGPVDRSPEEGDWERALLAHEAAAWVRHVAGAERPDTHAYLADLHGLPGDAGATSS
ncbi:MAG TPA: hypothetical protein VFK43_07685 [Acidimicrobiales bacterium]|nr:hypothetical protein [Acidimicrobiales bacterium]